MRKANLKLDSFVLFCSISQVSYWRQQLNSSNIENLPNSSLSGTQKCYIYGLYGFNKWLKGKTLNYKTLYSADHATFSYNTSKIQIEHVGHFLELYQNSQFSKFEFIVLIKQYLLWLQAQKGRATVNNALYSIKSFFRENDVEITFRFNSKKLNKSSDRILTINDFKKIITLKNIQVIEKAVFLCKFHRGLDNSTFADRFNFEAWNQLVYFFGTANFRKWNLQKCPVPIKLHRVKTDYQHMGFLDVDAVMAIQSYLKIRPTVKTLSNTHTLKKQSKSVTHNSKFKQPLFIDTFGNPISSNWITRRFKKLSKQAFSSQKNNTGVQNSDCASHELRDLLKSTLIDSGCRPDVADHVIGHSPKDSYEKQALLYPDSLRLEFSKCSNRINFLSKSNLKSNAVLKKTDQYDDFSIISKNQIRQLEQIISILQLWIKTQQLHFR